MTGTLAQIIAITTFGNQYLRNGVIPDNFYNNNTTFQFCNSVDFREFRKGFFQVKFKEVIVADNPLVWFKYIKDKGCKKLRLYYESSNEQSIAKDYKLAGLIGGGGTWYIEEVHENYSHYWAAKWEVTKKNDSARKIWSVSYGVFIKNQLIKDVQIRPETIKEKLGDTLEEISNFAFKQELKDWGNQFEKAKSNLNDFNPAINYYHSDLVPVNNYSLVAQQILFSAGLAWVFGGMGSWNDLGFNSDEDNHIYNRLSEALYSNINEAIISAVNSY